MRPFQTENCFTDLGDADEVNVSTDDFESLDAGDDSGYKDEDVDVEGSGEEPAVGEIAVELGAAISHSVVDRLADSKNTRG